MFRLTADGAADMRGGAADPDGRDGVTVMAYRSRLLARCALALCALAAPPGAAHAQLFWNPPDFSGEAVHGDEPGLGLPIPGATPGELDAYLLWNMRAGLNVAALQCQFSPALMTVRNYNDLLRNHPAELTRAYTTLGGYFKRIAGKGRAAAAQSQTTLDQFTTRTYNGFSTMHAQLGFCQTAASIGREAIGRPKGTLLETARTRMREFRNSLTPRGDRLFSQISMATVPLPPEEPTVDPCWDYAKNKKKRRCD